MKHGLWILAAFLCTPVFGAEVMPPSPARYFNDYAGVVSAQTAERLNQQLEALEDQTTNQVVVAIFPKMQSDASIDDYTRRVAESWSVGQKDKSNGAVLFVFIEDRTMFLQVGDGLRSRLSDTRAKRIIDNDITPAFKRGDFDAGLSAGVAAIIAATRETPSEAGPVLAENPNPAPAPVRQDPRPTPSSPPFNPAPLPQHSNVHYRNTNFLAGVPCVFCMIVPVMVILAVLGAGQRRRGVMYSSHGSNILSGLPFGSILGRRRGGIWHGDSNGDGFFGGGGHRSSDGGFSGGGGRFGGGGAGGGFSGGSRHSGGGSSGRFSGGGGRFGGGGAGGKW